MSTDPLIATLVMFLAAGVCALPFLPALIEWIAKTDAAPLVVVREQDANIRHFAASFFEQIQEFFSQHAIDTRAPPEPFEAAFGRGETAQFLGIEQKPVFTETERRSRRVRSVLISAGDLMLEGGFVFENEIYCGRQLYAGSNNTYRAVYAGTDLILGPQSTVARWLHSQGHVYIGEESRVFGRISSASSITLANGVRFERLNATVIRFESDTLVNVSKILEPAAKTPWEPPKNALKIDKNTVLIDQNAELPAHASHRGNIISKAELFLGNGCRISGNLKGRKRLTVGPSSVIRGSLVSEGEINIGASSLVLGPIVSETLVRIDTDCVIGAPRLPTSVTAPIIEIAIGSELSGTLWAAQEGRVVSKADETQDRPTAAKDVMVEQQRTA